MLTISVLLAGLVASEPSDLFRSRNLVAWCIVPFDAKQRGPAERIALLKKLGITRYAYDWRDKHLPTFDDEVKLCIQHGIQLHAVWFPAVMNKDAETILDVLKRNKVVTELWVMPLEPKGTSDEEKLEQVARVLRPVVKAANEAGQKIALYNHGGWIGEPENVLKLLALLEDKNVGVVYNLHHGHHHLYRLPEVFQLLKNHLRCVTINGMEPNGDKIGKKILPLGAGSQDVTVLRQLLASKYTGPIAILGHMHEYDVEDRLRDNLDGLEWLKAQLGGEQGKRPQYRTWK
jgi:sugar phosphate isomerase/epimerase